VRYVLWKAFLMGRCQQDEGDVVVGWATGPVVAGACAGRGKENGLRWKIGRK
jgi:hypothetical protein